jgi:hypothetical protein
MTWRTNHLSCSTTDKALRSDSNSRILAMGEASDFCLYEDCNKNVKSTSNLGGTYALPDGMLLRSRETKSYLAGREEFVV